MIYSYFRVLRLERLHAIARGLCSENGRHRAKGFIKGFSKFGMFPLRLFIGWKVEGFFYGGKRAELCGNDKLAREFFSLQSVALCRKNPVAELCGGVFVFHVFKVSRATCERKDFFRTSAFFFDAASKRHTRPARFSVA